MVCAGTSVFGVVIDDLVFLFVVDYLLPSCVFICVITLIVSLGLGLVCFGLL